MLTKEAFNALLKTLEEPPSHVIFILATTEPDKILETIISRCQRYDFKPVTFEESKNHLLMIAKSEGVEVDEESLRLVYEKSGGSMRDAISIFEKLISSCYGEKITLDRTEKVLGVIPGKKLEEFLSIVSKDQLEDGVSFLDNLWNDSINIEEFLKSFAYYLKELIIKGKSPFNVAKSINIIEDIFEVMGKFKYEEDKRLLGYVVLHKIINGAMSNDQPLIDNGKLIMDNEKEQKLKEENERLKRELEKQKTESKKQNIDNTTLEESNDEPIIKQKMANISIEDIKSNWTDIVNEAKRRKMPLISFLSTATPTKVEDGILHIGFYSENRFHKESMEKPYYNEVFLDVLKDKFGGRVVVKYDLLNKNSKVVEEKSDFVGKVMDFFDGELI
jgi:DNA polymerase-3 subunit gamma/tau